MHGTTEDARISELAFSWLFRFLSKRYLQLSSGKSEALKSEYLEHLYRKGILASFGSEDGATFQGKIAGVDEIGRLVIEREHGQMQKFSFREVKFII